MGGCRCSYKSCKSSTKRADNLHFFHYPVKHKERCAFWIHNANKPEFNNLPDDQLRNKVVCGLHFESKCFTNYHKNRLVQDAIPTIDSGCEEDLEKVLVVKEVEVFPTSTDGSTFTMQTEDLLPGLNSKNEKKYGYRNGKTAGINLSDSVSEVYTIDPSYIQQPYYSSTSSNNVFMNSEENSEELSEEIEACEEVTAIKLEHTMMQETEENLFCDAMEDMDFITPDMQPNERTNLNNCDNDFNSLEEEGTSKIEDLSSRISSQQQILKRISNNSYEINKIKQSLARRFTKVSKRYILKLLKGRVPDSLLGAVSLHLNKRETNLTQCENDFLHTMYAVSPSAFSTLKKSGWYLPNRIVLERTYKHKK